MATAVQSPTPTPVVPAPAPMQDLTKYYRALEKADAAGDTAGATEIANFIRAAEKGQGAPSTGVPAAPMTPTQSRNVKDLQAKINPIPKVKDFAKGLASAIDTVIVEPVAGIGRQIIYPTVRTVTSPERAEALTKSVLPSTLGKTFGIENDPAYQGEASRRATTAIGEAVGPHVEKAITNVSEATGVPKQDVGNIAANVTLGLPIIGYGRIGGARTGAVAPAPARAPAPTPTPTPTTAQMTANVLRRELDTPRDVVPDASADPLRTPVAPIRTTPEPQVSTGATSAPIAPIAAPAAARSSRVVPQNPDTALQPNQIPAQPTTVSVAQARANALRAQEEAKLAPPPPRQPESTMSGVGSADVGQMNVRVKTAENLPVPINLTKGKRTQELAHLQEENRLRYAHADEPSGRILLAEDAIANQRFAQNVDYLTDDLIGSVNPKDRGAVGDLINQDFRSQLKDKLTTANQLYTKAETSPEANMLLPANQLENFIGAQNPAIKRSAPILDIAESVLAGRKDITLKELMDLRKVVTSATKSNDTNAHYAGLLKARIDDIAREAEKGAPLFARAQKYYRLVKQEFEGKGAIEKLSHNKLNSSDPKVAAEAVVNTVLNGSKRDVENIVRRIKRSKNGEAIMRELRGNVIDSIFTRATRGVGKDVEGNAVISYSGLKAGLKNLKERKTLEVLFDAKERSLLNDIVSTADALFNEPALAKNYSGTYYGIAGELKRFGRRIGQKIPGINAAVEYAEEKARLASAREAIRPNQKALEKELKAIDARNKKERKGLL